MSCVSSRFNRFKPLGMYLRSYFVVAKLLFVVTEMLWYVVTKILNLRRYFCSYGYILLVTDEHNFVITKTLT